MYSRPAKTKLQMIFNMIHSQQYLNSSLHPVQKVFIFFKKKNTVVSLNTTLKLGNTTQASHLINWLLKSSLAPIKLNPLFFLSSSLCAALFLPFCSFSRFFFVPPSCCVSTFIIILTFLDARLKRSQG